MKKNNAMRLASALLVLVLLTTSIVGGTFAKYTTSANSSDTARVAKWGVAITANGTTFAKTYATDDGTVSGTIANSVVSTANVVAPGTTGSLAKATISGTPEVAVHVSYTGTLTLTGWDIGTQQTPEYYCPLVIAVNNTVLCGLDYASADEFKAAVEAAINGYSKDYAPNTNLSGKASEVLAISWSWSFEGTTHLVGEQTDAKDTALGDLPTAPTIELALVTTVTQID